MGQICRTRRRFTGDKAGGHFTSSIIDALRFEIPDCVTIYWLLMRRTAKKKPVIFLVKFCIGKEGITFSLIAFCYSLFLGIAGFMSA
jgi:hypothetical protein